MCLIGKTAVWGPPRWGNTDREYQVINNLEIVLREASCSITMITIDPWVPPKIPPWLELWGDDSYDTYFNSTQPLPDGGAVQNTCILVLLRGVLSVTAGGQFVINCVSSSSIICRVHKTILVNTNVSDSNMAAFLLPSLHVKQKNVKL